MTAVFRASVFLTLLPPSEDDGCCFPGLVVCDTVFTE